MAVPILGGAVPRRGNRFSAGVCRWLFGRLGWRIAGDLPDVAKAVLVVAPHTSNWDFLIGVVAMFALGLRVSFLAKSSLFRWPFGPVMRWLGGVSVDRGASRGVVEQTVRVLDASEALIMVIAPEGTRGQVTHWKSGYYHIAVGAGVPILPVSFDYRLRLISFGEALTRLGDLGQVREELDRFFAGAVGKRGP